MPELKLTKKFLKDLENLRKKDKKKLRQVIKSMALLEQNPLHPGLHIERIVNDPSAWSARVDRRLRISFEPQQLEKLYIPHGSDKTLNNRNKLFACTNGRDMVKDMYGV